MQLLSVKLQMSECCLVTIQKSMNKMHQLFWQKICYFQQSEQNLSTVKKEAKNQSSIHFTICCSNHILYELFEYLPGWDISVEKSLLLIYFTAGGVTLEIQEVNLPTGNFTKINCFHPFIWNNDLVIHEKLCMQK